MRVPPLLSLPALLAACSSGVPSVTQTPPTPVVGRAARTEALAETFEGTFEPRWWPQDPGYGASPDDGWSAALVLRLAAPKDGVGHIVYATGGVDDLEPDATALGCVGGHAIVHGHYTPVAWPEAPAVLTDARVVECSPAEGVTPRFGESATLTGTLRRWWWRLPGKESRPWPESVSIGGALVVDGLPTPIFPGGTDGAAERLRRYLAACDGQQVTVRGRWEPTRNAAAIPPYKLVDVTFEAPCASPVLHRPAPSGDQPMSAGWLDGPADVGESALPAGRVRNP